MKIAIDIDNTIVDYRKSILNSLIKRKINYLQKFDFTTESVNKIKDIIKDEIDDDLWQIIQADIYSDKSKDIYFYDGCDLAIKTLSDYGYQIYLVSHKTKYGIKHAKNVNILEISQERIFNWIKNYKLEKKINGIFYCNSFMEKINFINFLKPNVIIDDLEKIFDKYIEINNDSNQTSMLLFNGSKGKIYNKKDSQKVKYVNISSWSEIPKYLFNDE